MSVLRAAGLVDAAGAGNPLAVPLAVLVGVPLYSNAAAVVPLIGVLTQTGVAIGTSLAFMMAVVGLYAIEHSPQLSETARRE